jgi:HEAT repeat protein
MGPPAKAAIPALKGLLGETDKCVRVAAAGALVNLGESAVAMPAIKTLLKDGEPYVPLEARFAEEGDTLSSAAKILDTLGPGDQGAIPGLVAMLSEGYSRGQKRAAKALGRIGPRGIPALMDLLRRGDEDRRYVAAVGLAEIRPADKVKIASTLAEWLAERDWGVREAAVVALGAMGPDTNAVPALVRLLDDKDSRVRLATARALEQTGPDAKRALPALGQRLQDDDWAVRDAAAWAVKVIDGAGDEKAAR